MTDLFDTCIMYALKIEAHPSQGLEGRNHFEYSELTV